jgi:hypothetical protein
LPSGCYLVKINVTKRVLDRLTADSSSSSSSSHRVNKRPVSDFFDLTENESTTTTTTSDPKSDPVNNDNDTFDQDLVEMDTLPETTRFTTTVSINKLNIIDFIDNENEQLDNFDDYYYKDDDIDDDDDDSINDDAVMPVHRQPHGLKQLTMYVQKNSRLKLVLLSLDSAASQEQYKIDNLIRNWQTIVTNFSNLEYELIDHERKLESNATTPTPNDLDDIFHRTTPSNTVMTKTSRKNSSLINNSNGINVPQALPTNNNNNDNVYQNLSNFTCLIDRNRLVKYTSKSKSFHTFPQSTSIIANMNNFYELLQSMPELSKLEIK